MFIERNRMGWFFLLPQYRGALELGTEKSGSEKDRTGGFKISREKAGRFSPTTANSMTYFLLY